MKISSMSIIKKFLFGLFMIFTFGVIITIYFGTSIIEENNENIITKELLNMKYISKVYVHQKLLFHHNENDETYLKLVGNELVQELQKVLNTDISINDKYGNIISSTDSTEFINSYKDIKHAENKKTAYTIETKNDKVLVYFSYPIIYANSQIGIVRIIKDYSYLYNYNSSIIKSILKIIICVFFVSLIFVFLLTRSFIKPIINLSKLSQKVSNGDFKTRAVFKNNDEIGVLSKNFNSMVYKIENQIDTIKNDRDKLIEINKFRKKFYDNVTHELKTPLTTILGYSSLLKNKEYNKEFFDKSINYITEESERLHKMVLGLLEYSKNGNILEDEFENINISELIINTTEEMKIKAKRYGMKIITDIHNDYYINGVSDKLKEVFINIIDNAIKYGYPNTDIYVTTESKDNFLYIYIKNSGKYIPKEKLDKLFIPFYKLNNNSVETGSTGLGLSICKEVLENHNGEIDIESKPQEEYIVTISLPL